MAHIGQELGLEHIGGLSRVTRLHQVDHRPMQRLVIGLQLAEQGVETVRQLAEFVMGPIGHPAGIVAAVGHVAHGLGQDIDRLHHAAGQPAAHEQGHGGGGEEQAAADRQIAREQGGEIARRRAQNHVANRAAVGDDRRAGDDQVFRRGGRGKRGPKHDDGRARRIVNHGLAQARRHVQIGESGPHIAAIAANERRADLAGHDAGEDLPGVLNEQAFGAPLFEDEHAAGQDEHSDRGGERRNRDPVLEGDSPRADCRTRFKLVDARQNQPRVPSAAETICRNFLTLRFATA